MTVICTIALVVNLGFPVETKADVQGKVKSQGVSKFLVDFSKEVKEKYPKVEGDYSRVLVDKSQCVEVK